LSLDYNDTRDIDQRPRVTNGSSARRIGAIALAAAATLAATALYVRHRTRRAEREYPPSGRFIEVDGVRLHYIEKGEGPPVVLLHGNGATKEDFAISGLSDLASETYRVVAFDRPGYGYSERPRDRLWSPRAQAKLLRDAFARIGIERPVVVGHSWGTLVALALALDYPADVRGLVLMSGYYFPTARADVLMFAPPAIPVLGDAMRYTVSPLIGRMLAPRMVAKMFAPRPVPPRFTTEFPLDLSLRPSQIRASAESTAFMIPAAAALRQRYRELTMPVMILAGADDRIVDVGRQAARLHQELPQSELRVLPGLGHMLHHSVPARVVEAIHTVASARPAEEPIGDRAPSAQSA
jgi:pimeloyl-ACP methyl ester carboxylesterase